MYGDDSAVHLCQLWREGKAQFQNEYSEFDMIFEYMSSVDHCHNFLLSQKIQ